MSAVALATAALVPNAIAAKFDVGPFEATFTSRLSVGASWRTEDPSNRVVTPGNTQGRGQASSGTTDDGNLNYAKGDMYSLQFRGLHDLDLNAGSWGVFTRVKYWYDYEQANGDVLHGHAANDYAAGEELDLSGFEDLAQDKGFVFLDYYLYGEFDLGQKPLELRAGNMVLNWGENLFIQNGVNVVSPVDVTALRRPGSEIREALLPVGMVYGNFGVTDNLSVEGFYQYDWQRTILDECGTYWSSADPYGGGCDYLTASASLPDGAQVGTIFQLGRAPDLEASDSGQYGFSARYFAESLNSTEFGLYYLNTHSRTPIFSAINTEVGLGQPILNPAVAPQYFFEFPEDIEVFGASFTTNIGDWAWSGEATYRPDFPLQINTTELLQALSLGIIAEWSPMLPRSLAAGPGGYVSGYDDVSYTQVQTSVIKFFEQVGGADRISLAAEVGAVWLGGMDDNVNYGRSAAYGANTFDPFASNLPPLPGLPPITGAPISCNSHPYQPLGVVANPTAEYCEDEGFTTDFSWGYRLRVAANYNNAFAGINLTPSLAWSHDVSGYSPAPNFIEDRMALSLGLRGDYLNVYQAELSYTSFFGADYNELQDRDFVSVSFSVAF
ncbi:type V secretory pathway, adhesin AidA [gamma proteobacterium NOR5-3]|nr:type V secretory pathway, adhesin AidA [gamma proteobacterium NOR5-3]